MADRKQGAGLSSGSSTAVHKANCSNLHEFALTMKEFMHISVPVLSEVEIQGFGSFW